MTDRLTPLTFTAPSSIHRSRGVDRALVAQIAGGAVTPHDTSLIQGGAASVRSDRVSPAPATPGSWATAGRKVMMGALLSLTVGGALLSAAAPSMAAQPQSALIQTVAPAAQDARDLSPVHASTVQDAVSRFNHSHPLMVVGGTLTPQETASYQNALKSNPNSFVVVVANDTLVDGTPSTLTPLARGIANSSEFTNVTASETGQSDGVLFLMYPHVTDAGGAPHQQVYLRAADLPTSLGVGASAFAQGAPLRTLFSSELHQGGKDFGGALKTVLAQINGTIQQSVSSTVQGAQSSLDTASSALDAIKPDLKQFNIQYGSEGTLSNPPVKTWDAQLAAAANALKHHDFQTAARLSAVVSTAIDNQTHGMVTYTQAGPVADGVGKDLAALSKLMPHAPANDAGALARTSFADATRFMDDFQSQYKMKDPSFVSSLEQGRSAATAATQALTAAQDDVSNSRTHQEEGLAALALLLLVGGAGANWRARKAGRASDNEIAEASHQVGQDSAALMKTLGDAKFWEVAAAEGETHDVARDVTANLGKALALVGGGQKFLDECQKLVATSPHLGQVRDQLVLGLAGPDRAKHFGEALRLLRTPVKNFFLTGNFTKASALLNDPNATMTFEPWENARRVVEGNTQATDWVAREAARGDSRAFTMSFKTLMGQMAARRQEALASLDALTTTKAGLSGELTQEETHAHDAETAAKNLAANATDGLFTAPAVLSTLLPTVLAPEGACSPLPANTKPTTG